jgi:penicillin G amidase
MKVVKISVSLLVTLLLIYLLNNSQQVGSTRVPPLGKFLDPFHGFWQNIESDGKPTSTALDLAGLEGKVTIYLDSLLIPHIFATTDEDLFIAQGYVTAMHRLWQMEFQTHAAAGRISEIIGAGANDGVLNYDRGQRRLGMVHAARNAVAGMEENPLTKAAIEKYAEGVNQYIQSLRYKDLPFEYKLLDYEPEPWTTLKSALLLRSMAQTLNMGDKDIEMTNALTLFGKDAIDLLYPDREAVTDPIVDNAGKWTFKPVTLETVPSALPAELIEIKKKIPGSDPTTGSNNWAVSGTKTATGSPMLCSDPHLGLSLPSIWYAIQLHSPTHNVMGVSIPGAPHVIIGFNDSIAWGVTNAQRDLVDWYRIEFKDASKKEYRLDDTWVKSNPVVETFNVRGTAPFSDTVIYTHWGPVTYDESYHADDNLKHYAFRWVSHDKSNESLTFYELNRAKNHSDYLQALNHYSGPAQNFAFASVSGDIAIRIQGKFPVRRKNEGKFVLDGSKTTNGWQAFIPNDQNVMIKNPERGFISSANQYPADSTYPYYIQSTNYEAYRNRRINNTLRTTNNIVPEDLMKLQNDNYNLKAAESLPYFIEQVKSISSLGADEKQALEILTQWDYFNNINSEGASYYEAWWDALMPLIWDEMKKENTALGYPTAYQTIKLLKEQPALIWFDVVATPEKENAQALLIQSFRESVATIEKWKADHKQQTVAWADFKDSYVGHLLRIDALSVFVKHGGNHDIVNANSRTHGPSWRMVTSLEKTGVKAWATYPGGQSGNPGSKYYTNLLARWTSAQYFPLSFMHSSEESTQMSTLTLNPTQK